MHMCHRALTLQIILILTPANNIPTPFLTKRNI